MAGLVLYDNPSSSNALKVRFLLAELGLPYERRTIPLSRPRPDDYLALNPVGGIPAIDDDGFVLTESHAILRHLAAREGRDDLWPADPRERAVVDEFLERWNTGIRAAFFRHEAPSLGYSREGGMGAVAPDPEAAAAAARALQPTLALLERLAGPERAVLGRLTIADCAVAPVLFRSLRTGLDLSGHPRLASLREALVAHPSFVAAGPVA